VTMEERLTNLAIFEAAEVTEFYRREERLYKAEEYLFERHIAPGSDIIDIGVGGGRTAEFLAKSARRYLGIDYSSSMVAACRQRFPHLSFACADATNLSDIGNDSFDVTVFSANGFDCIPSDEARMQCLRELRRVTRPTGCIILSSHNAKILVVLPDFDGARWPIWRIIYSLGKTFQVGSRSLLSRAFYSGEGYIKDAGHWGMTMYVSTPQTIKRDAESVGLRVIDSRDYRMASRSKYLIGWYYYVMAMVEPQP
jgi:SAM-dependent methyltransferase